MMAAPSFEIASLEADELASVLPECKALVQCALVPAGYQAPELIHPILARQPAAALATVRQGGRLAFACAAEHGKFFDRSLASPLIASGLPLVDVKDAVEILRAFLNSRSKPFLFTAVPADGAFYEALQKAGGHHFVLRHWRRAGLGLRGTYENWLADNFDHKRRKELKRLRARLAEQGALKSESLNHISALPGFVEDLLQLESNGWKGARGTALQNSADGAEAFREAAHALAAAGKLRFWRISLNGAAIATLFAIVEGHEAWLGKIAYDERFAKYSPGTLLILDATQSLFTEGTITRVDSSAIPGHPMIDRIWRDRIGFQDVLVAGEGVSPLGFWLVAWGLLAKQIIRDMAKAAFYWLSKRKRS